ncbi:hypothetical protein E2320_006874 [Naja naja]|nr:hypothetical protein E2320_006874 [Naja naja]
MRLRPSFAARVRPKGRGQSRASSVAPARCAETKGERERERETFSFDKEGRSGGGEAPKLVAGTAVENQQGADLVVHTMNQHLVYLKEESPSVDSQ